MAFFPSWKQNFIAYRSSQVSSRPDCIFEIQQLWQSGFSRVYSNCCCSWSFEPEIIKIGQPSHKMYSNNTVNFQESKTILNACTKKSGKLLKAPRISIACLMVYRSLRGYFMRKFDWFVNLSISRLIFLLSSNERMKDHNGFLYIKSFFFIISRKGWNWPWVLERKRQKRRMRTQTGR